MTIKSLMRLKPHRVVQEQDGGHDQLTNHAGGLWSNLPPEILRDILIRLEASASRWPTRRCLVACAGVCRSWRFVAKEVAPIPEISGRLTFPISVKQPGTRDRLIRCFIKRSRSALTYELYLNITDGLIDEGKLLLSAQKCKKATCTDYIISLSANVKTKDNNTCVGKLRQSCNRSHLIRSECSRCEMLWLILFCEPHFRGSRRMQCIMDSIPATAIEPGGIAPTQTELSFRNIRWPHLKYSTRRKESISSTCPKQPDALVLRNKSPRWHENLQCWCLNFHGRVTVASVKNFQLLACPEDEKVILQFGKVEKDIYTMDYCYPLSAFQAFAICLSSFHTKIACEL